MNRRIGARGFLVLVAIVASIASAWPASASAWVWTPSGSVGTGRELHTATRLPDGRVLVAGGSDGSQAMASAEIYDPASGTWTATGNMVTARYSHTATLLPDGRILVAGGYGPTSVLASAEIYDPASGTWTNTASMATVRSGHTATRLAGGKVFVAGGWDSNYLASSEIYDPHGNVAPAASMAMARGFHTATRLPDGRWWREEAPTSRARRSTTLRQGAGPARDTWLLHARPTRPPSCERRFWLREGPTAPVGC